MDRKIENLDECIYDYLAYHSNIMKSIKIIYMDLCGTSGHRCSALTTNNISLKNSYERKFKLACKTLSDKYSDIIKIQDDKTLYLMHKKESDSDSDSIPDIDDIEIDWNINERYPSNDIAIISQQQSTLNELSALVKNKQDQIDKLINDKVKLKQDVTELNNTIVLLRILMFTIICVFSWMAFSI